MVFVLFEVTIKPEGRERYLEIAASLGKELAKAEGFLRSERFSSLATEGKLLSLSVWENEAAVTQWRNLGAHRMGQREGRNSLFQDYRITVLQPIRDYGMDTREEAPADSNALFVSEQDLGEEVTLHVQ